MYGEFNQFNDFKTPCHKLEVNYENDKEVDLGTIFTPDDVESSPSVKYSKADNKQYELVMVDYDNMKNRNKEDWLLWHIKNIPGDDIKDGKLGGVTPDKEYKKSSSLVFIIHHYLIIMFSIIK